jgi:hypothetical protein
MKNKEIFTLNPDDNNLINDGVVEINTAKDEQGFKIIRHELKTFVCEGEYQRGIVRMLDSYLKHINEPKQPAAWVSGFFGSGKSHLVKILSYLWEDLELPNGETARKIKQLPQDVNDLLVELDRKQKVYGKLSVTGTLKDFPSNDIRYSFLQLFLKSLGLPSQYHHFKFVYWAKSEGIYDELKSLVESKGKNFESEYENLFVSTTLANALLQLKPEFAENEAKVKENFKANFKRVDNISRDQLIHTIKDEVVKLMFGGKLPCTIIVLDEIQQFIGNDANKTINIQNLAQDISSSFDGKFLLVGTGQNALSETPALMPLQDRFSVKISISDTDVETVTRKTVLEKKPSFVKEIDKKLDTALGEISRNLSGTDFGYRTDDKNTLVSDYPILPSTRKFWTKILQVIDTAGTSGQLRSQLRIIDDSLKKVADKELGNIVPADFVFEQKQQQLLSNALLLNETNSLIEERKSKGGDSALEARILIAIFLIDQLPKDIHGGRLKSDENTIADLLLENLNESSDNFREKIKELIAKLVNDKVLMPIDDEYKLQTKIGAEWEKEYTSHAIKIGNSGDDKIQELRKEKLLSFFNDRTKTISVLQGVSKENRKFVIWDKVERPKTESSLNLWVRDGWNENESTVLNEIRSEGDSSAIAYSYVKKFRDPELRNAIIRFLSAKLTLDTKGLPSTPEGEQARKSMETRMGLAKADIDDLILKICTDSEIYLAGGNRVNTGNLRDNIEEALGSIADRQFPEFKSKGDYKDWDKALAKAISGDPDALKKIGFDKDPKDHPIAVEMLRFIGNGSKQGKDFRSEFMKSPYGWSQDAIDTMLIMLLKSGYLSTPEPNINQSKLGSAVFKKEIHTLNASNKIQLRKIYQDSGISCKPNEEFQASNLYLETLKNLADTISGDPPKPQKINLDFIKEIENLDGNERLLRIIEEQADLKVKYEDWKSKAELVVKREPQWNLLYELANFAIDGNEFDKLREEIDAIYQNRLLFLNPDPIQPKLQELTEKLKIKLNELKSRYIEIYDKMMDEIQENPLFRILTPDQRLEILSKHQLISKPEIKSLDSHELLNQLRRESLYNWDTKIAALPGQFQSALEDAILLSAPQAKTYTLPRKTINNQSEIDNYIEELKKQLEDLLKSASSIILK